jgi:hypothetical protein
MQQPSGTLGAVPPRVTTEELGRAISAMAYGLPSGPTATEQLFWWFLVLTAPGAPDENRTRWKGSGIVAALRSGTRRPEEFSGPERDFAEAAAAVLALPEAEQTVILERVRVILRDSFG